MESTKLTLRPPADIVKMAHEMAEEEHTSISQLFATFILKRRLEKGNYDLNSSLSPMLSELLSLTSEVKISDYRQEMEDALAEKYQIDLNP